MNGPRNERERIIYLEEEARLSVQAVMNKAMKASGLRYKDIAAKLEITPDEVEEMLDSGTDLTIFGVARFMDAVGHKIVFSVMPT